MGYSIWLDFSDECESKLQKQIHDISTKFLSPEFKPHLTLVGDIELELDAVKKLADVFFSIPLPLNLTIKDVRISTNYFMALYLLVTIPDELQLLRKLTAEAVNPKSYALDTPHVSLAYGVLDQGTLAQEQYLLRNEFSDRELLVRGISIVKSSKLLPVADWKAVETINFS